MKRMILLLIIAALSLSGCSPYSLVPSGNSHNTTVSERGENIPDPPTSDRDEDYVRRVALYFVSSDRQQLTPISRTLTVRFDDTLLENIVERLLGASSSDGVRGIVPSGTTLLYVEDSCSIATVNLSFEAANATSRDLMWMKAAIANSLIGVNDTNYVQVLINGREQSGMLLPTGAMTFTGDSLQALWTRKSTEEERFSTSADASMVSRDLVLYYPAISGNFLLPEVRSVTFNTADIEKLIIDELSQSPQNELCRSAFSENIQPAAELVTLDDGGRVVSIAFDTDVNELSRVGGFDMWRTLASIAFSMCRNIPELDGVVVTIGGEWIFSASSGDRSADFRDGIMRPDDFGDAVGDVAKLYFSDGNGSLKAIDRVLPAQNTNSARALIAELIKGPLPGEDCHSVFPDGVTIDDIIGIRIQDQCALINLTANFYTMCQNLSFVQERGLVYSMVNTLCEMSGVNRVRFYVNSEVADTLTDYISIRSELLANPGLVA
ncbi:MAG: GerMN domain-containing protein [Clostridia bacterium]|nr:GerMN domain-containing protein [Clostridia bacterium]